MNKLTIKQIEQAPLLNKNHPKHGVAKRNVMKIGAGILAVTGIGIGANLYSGHNANMPSQFDGTSPAEITIGPGSALRSTPAIIDPSLTGDGSSNLVTRVGKDEQYVVSNPIQKTVLGNSGNDTWIGFKPPGSKEYSWADLTQLSSQGLVNEVSGTDASMLKTEIINNEYKYQTPDGQWNKAGVTVIQSTK